MLQLASDRPLAITSGRLHALELCSPTDRNCCRFLDERVAEPAPAQRRQNRWWTTPPLGPGTMSRW
jgi:hypothetical protein